MDKAEVDEKTYSPNDGSIEYVPPVWRRVFDSFKPHVLNMDTSDMTEEEKINAATRNSPLSRSLKSRHLQMIAIGGSIGTGLFVGSGKAIAQAGGAATLLGFAVIGVMLYCTVNGLGEVAVTYPQAGSFTTLTIRFIHKSWGVAMAWMYALMWTIVLPVELVAASITLEYWDAPGNPIVWVILFYVVTFGINMFGVRGYAEAEFTFSLVKVVAVVGFIIFGIVYNCGGVPNGEGYIGGRYWQDPGAFNNGFHGFCSVFVTAAFSFSGTELVGLASAETANPRKTLPSAIKQVFWRLLLFYIISLTIVGLNVPYTDPRLLSAKSSSDNSASPFTIMLVNAGVHGLPSVINAVILIAVLSVGNSAVYGASRTLAALGAQGYAPKWFGFIDRGGRPMAGIGITAVMGFLSFVVASGKQNDAFNWLMSFTGLCLVFTWSSINLIHVRFRMAYRAQGRALDDLSFKSPVGMIGSMIAFIINVLVLAAQFYTALYPIGGPYLDAKGFFQAYLAAVVMLVAFLGHLIITRPRWVPASEIDLVSGRRETDLDLLRQEIAEERAYIKSRGWWYRIYKFFF